MPPKADEFAVRLESQMKRGPARTAAVNRPEPSRAAEAPDQPRRPLRSSALSTRVSAAFVRPEGIGPASAAQAGDPRAGQDEFSGRLAGQLARAESHELEDEPEPAAALPAGGGPVGSGGYVVRAGDCISSIAAEHGHLWQTLWDEPGNAELRQVRQDPNTLLEGDRVTVPPIRPRHEPGMAELRHRFRKKGQPEALRLRILQDDKPRANEPYLLDVDGEQVSGTTDAHGQVVRQIKPTARRAKLTVGSGDAATEYIFHLGALDPLDVPSGVQARLNSLGFAAGAEDGRWTPQLRRAIEDFQAHHGLPVSGQADGPTRQKLREAYGC